MLDVGENSIDGSCLEVLTEQDLTELGVESNLKRKKMMQCNPFKLMTGI
jgi:hypothetical protein